MKIRSHDFAMIVAAISIALVAASLVEFPASSSNHNSITTEHRQSLLFESICTTYPAYVNVTSVSESQNISIGFDISPQELDFGALPGGSISRKFLHIFNPSSDRARVMVKASGAIASIIGFSDSDFFMDPGASVDVKASVAPEASDSGIYSGEVTIIYRQSRLNFLDFLV
jgi:hypothetical protein